MGLKNIPTDINQYHYYEKIDTPDPLYAAGYACSG